MKARIPKEFSQLKESEKRRINAIMAKRLDEQIDHEEAELQKIWLQYACVVLNRMFMLGNKRLRHFLLGWKRMYYQNSKMTSEEQKEYLRQEMERIFGKDGYPYEWVDELEHQFD